MKKKEYSGPFLWLAAISFIMPIAVAAYALRQIPRPFTYPEIRLDKSGVDQNLWNSLLQNYVSDGLIDYDGLKRDHHFKEYVAQIAAANPAVLDQDSQLAFYCNAYNALVIDGVISNKIKTSVMEYKNSAGKGFFDAGSHILADETIDLNTLEHKRIRPTFNEPRIHMALVCAAKSCPRIRGEAYFGDRIREQLADQARLFANNSEYVRFNAEQNALYLSPILKWYANDFGGREGYLDFLKERCEDMDLRNAIERAKGGELEVRFNEYDWSLNSQGKATSSGKSGPALGSGSVHNDEI